MIELFPISSEIMTLAQRVGQHPARLAIWNEGSVATRLSTGKLVVSAANAHLARLDAAHLVELDLARMQQMVANEAATDEQVVEAMTDPGGFAPCADAFMYADLLGFEGVRFAAHTQPVPVNQIICSPRARQFADRRNLPHEIVACGTASVLVPFAPPGVALARETKRKIALWRDRFKTVPKLVLIQNHGMIALGDTIDEVMMIIEMTVKFAEIFAGAAMLGGPEFLKLNHVAQIEQTRLI